ncbi:MAG TPA: GDSL-type esterase/lipase family protein [Bryobacteraceae bacterium]|nr:GDSL-type esterase/lipase family protein [Bryobacteraceae bacterium]
MNRLWLLGCAALLLRAQAPAPDSALLSYAQVIESCQRAIQLMESTGVALPELSRAGAPLVENARQILVNLRLDTASGDLNYSFLANLRAYVALSDAVPRPFPFSEEAQKQLHELRDLLARFESHVHALVAQKDQQLRAPDRDNLARYADLDSRIGPPKPDKPRVVFLGDSITDRWRLNEYFPERDFVNRGIGGQITGQMLGRMESDVIRLQPAAIVVLGGTNDIARGVPINAIEDNLAMIADLAAFYKIRVVLASLLPISDYHKDADPNYERTRTRPPSTIRTLNDWIKGLCGKRNLIYLDYYSQVVDSSGFLKADLSDDGLHPNSAGYRLMAQLALKAINQVIAPAPEPAQQKKRRFFGKTGN